MNLIIPPMPSILKKREMAQRIQWEKWYAFYNLPLERKDDIIHEYQELVIEKEPSLEDKKMGIMFRKFFNPDALDRIVPYGTVFRHYDVITDGETFPKQTLKDLDYYLSVEDETQKKGLLMLGLTPFNYAVLAYKYRYNVRPESFYFGMDYEVALMQATTLDELLSFYDLTRKD